MHKGNVISIVRSTITPRTDRDAFDHWYSTDHMPKVVERLRPEEGFRFWSVSDPRIHVAVYRYRDRASIEARSPDAYKGLIAEFDAAWPGVTRTNEWLEAADHVRPEALRATV